MDARSVVRARFRSSALTLFGSWISYIYSAPPLKLKQEGWRGNYALGASYIALPWWAGGLFGELSLDVMVMTVLYSIAGLGIAIVNDFKSIEGDRQMGLMSLPVAFGVEKAKWICVGSIDATQLAVAGYRQPEPSAPRTTRTRSQMSSSPRFSSSSSSSSRIPSRTTSSTRPARSPSWCSACSPPAWRGVTTSTPSARKGSGERERERESEKESFMERRRDERFM